MGSSDSYFDLGATEPHRVALITLPSSTFCSEGFSTGIRVFLKKRRPIILVIAICSKNRTTFYSVHLSDIDYFR